eukprot:SM000196S05369  [mRNA]  locus=s196:156873:160461:+ [translate_table: standard]
MLEVDCPCVTPEAVLRASGHVDKFTDLMVKDEKTGTCFRPNFLGVQAIAATAAANAAESSHRRRRCCRLRADHLLKDHLEEVLERGPLMPAERREELRHLLATVDELGADELGAALRRFGICAPDTKNELSHPYPFNLMFSTMIGPSGLLQGYLRPETAQGIFVNFKDLLYHNGNKLPFAAAQIGQAFRNEIAPRAGLLRVREFTLAEIEHFVHPENKRHAKFASVADLEFLLYPQAQQLGPKTPVRMRLGDAVAAGTIDNETLGYFIGRTFLFLTALGINPERLRFRQHLQHEMAHYAADCWDAEIECSYGWVECVGLADRSAFDLKAHTVCVGLTGSSAERWRRGCVQEKSKVELVAHERFPEPKEMQVLEVAVNKKELGKCFKKDAKVIQEALEALPEEEALIIKSKLASEGSAPLTIYGTGQEFSITKDMVSISKELKRLTGRNFTPSVIEPSFGIGRIIYCLYEHSFYTRENSEDKTVFRFTPLVAPIKCTVFPLVAKPAMEEEAARISRLLTRAGLANKIDTTGTSIGKRYARTDELGVPCAITVDEDLDAPSTVTLRDRDSTLQVRIHKDEVAGVVKDIFDGVTSWQAVTLKYPRVVKDADTDS